MNRILSLFDCPLKDVKRLLPLISRQGFNTVQVSPLQKCKTDSKDSWYLLYQPLGFEIGNRIGTKEELYDLCLEAKKYNINIVVDAVINHVANKSEKEFLEPHPDTDEELLDNKDCFKKKKQITNWDDRNQVINYCLGLPGLNPNNPLVQKKIISMLNEYSYKNDSDCDVIHIIFSIICNLTELYMDNINEVFDQIKKMNKLINESKLDEETKKNEEIYRFFLTFVVERKD